MLRKMTLVFLSLIAISAQAGKNDPYYTIGSVKVTQESEQYDGNFSMYAIQNDCSEFDAYDIELKDLMTLLPSSPAQEIINIGQQIWKIIEANKPVVNIEMPMAHAFPRAVKCWTDLDRWQNPKSATYRTTYKNLYGMTVIDFAFRVSYIYGGQRDGKGQYLANVTVVPADLSVAWGYTFNAKTVMGTVVNVGTKEDPIAGMSLTLNWQIKTVVKDAQSTMGFFIRGDGGIQQLQ